MKTKPRILFLSHSASRNGATILLLHFLRWLKRHVDWEMEVLVDGSGPLVADLRAVTPTTVWRSPAFLLRAFPGCKTAALQARLETPCLKALLVGRRFDLIYANTVATWSLVRALADRAPALLWHIHELAYAFRLSVGEQRAGDLFPATSRFVTVSKSVRDTLSREFNVPAETVDLVHGFVPVSPSGGEEPRSRRERIRRQLGWPVDAFVVGGCGTLGWRKGSDLFLQIARAVCDAPDSEKVRFLWVGGAAEGREALEFNYDLRALGLQERCGRVPTTPDALDYYAAMDVLALTSREDPFPLVMLEAASQSMPVVCFAGSGGGPEFVGDDAGLIAPYLDLPAFAAHLIQLKNMPDLCERLGVAASTKVRTQHSVEVQAPKLLEIMERCLPLGRPGLDRGIVLGRRMDRR